MEEEEETNTTSDDESHNVEDEPEPDSEHVLEDVRLRIERYLRTERWGDQEWNNYHAECRFYWYRHHWRNFRRRRNRPHTIPFDESDYGDVRFAAYPQTGTAMALLDITIADHRVRDGILEGIVFRVVQPECNANPVYTNNVRLDPAEIVLRRIDARGFPTDRYRGTRSYGRFLGRRIGWYPINQLCHTCPNVVMTYFLRRRPMEVQTNADWHLWSICYNMIRHNETFPNRERNWTLLDYSSLSDTENENDQDSDGTDETLY
jgi:hypothetical protein